MEVRKVTGRLQKVKPVIPTHVSFRLPITFNLLCNLILCGPKHIFLLSNCFLSSKLGITVYRILFRLKNYLFSRRCLYSTFLSTVIRDFLSSLGAVASQRPKPRTGNYFLVQITLVTIFSSPSTPHVLQAIAEQNVIK